MKDFSLPNSTFVKSRATNDRYSFNLIKQKKKETLSEYIQIKINKSESKEDKYRETRTSLRKQVTNK